MINEDNHSFRQLKLARCKAALESNHFEVYLARDPGQAHRIFMEKILPACGARSISWGDSMTLHATGVLEALRRDPRFDVLVTFDAGVPREDIIQRRRRALLVDLFLTGTNAITETGTLVNLDMVGNRTAALAFGPRHVVIMAGRNKLVPDLDAAMHRIRATAAPANAIRHTGFKTPCIKTGVCMDCRSPDRICNVWSILEKSYPQKRVKVILIDRDLGL